MKSLTVLSVLVVLLLVLRLNGMTLPFPSRPLFRLSAPITPMSQR